LTLSLGALAHQVEGEVHGDATCLITGVATLRNAGPGSISFLANPHYRKHLATTAATAVILATEDLQNCPVAALVSANPYLTYARVAAILHRPSDTPQGVHRTAWVSPKSRVHKSAWVGPHCVVEEQTEIGPKVILGPGCMVGKGSTIGALTHLVAHVTLCQGVRIGCRGLIHPGVVIGSDGFGIANDNGVWVKVPQLGGVMIGDDVEIGANTTIDRGALEDTVVEDGVKLDNQIQIAHNVRIGAHTAVAACVGIAGSTTIGRHCIIGGGAGIAGHVEIADYVQINAMSGVSKSIKKPGVYASGIPAEPNQQWRRNCIRIHQLDDMARRLKALERALNGQQPTKEGSF
jgi:UDP-3-O-[3-hydroxymyristoyl] glucosamine N-acyltransferase